jgi:hypothetical protein
VNELCSSKGAAENGAPKPSEASAPTSRLGAADDETQADVVVNCANVPNTEMPTSPSARFDREYAR